MKIRAASDVGGTFTDLVYCEVNDQTGAIESIQTKKGHTTPPNFEEGVLDTLKNANISFAEMVFFAHGSTVVINALTERKGVKTGLIMTRGFRDILEIARGNRPDFFNLRYQKPEPFIPRYLRREITERLDYKGKVIKGLALEELPPILTDFKEEGVEAIAVCLLHSYANPDHEQALAAEIKSLWPDVAIIASHHVSREWREYERSNTAALCAYVQPIAEKYLSNMEDALHDNGFDGSFYVMRSNGGIDTVKSVKKISITAVESGPASGVLGAAALGKLLDIQNIIAFDVGGTTAKCSLIDNGRVSVTSQYMIEKTTMSAGYPIMTPVVDIVEIGNGGGSIAWIDNYDKMHVGPQSAGALPGPVAYGKGGSEPTTTDANLMLNRINPDYFIGGEIQADMKKVYAAFEKLGDRIDLPPRDAARGVVRIANHNMANALKLVSTNRGYDPRDFTMVAFGGGGAMHAAALAKELNIPKVIVPAHSAVFSAWGMLLSDLRRDYVRTSPMPLDILKAAAMSKAFVEMENESLASFTEEGFSNDDIYFERFLDMRYEGQEHSVRVPITSSQFAEESIDLLRRDFGDAYEREYTYRLDNDVEIVSFHLAAYATIEKPELSAIAENMDIKGAIKEMRDVDFDEAGIVKTVIYNREKLGAGANIKGPAVIEESGTTTVIFPDQSATVDQYGNLHITI
ncbi:hydantoinase/oxoprolinase family protein [Parasphingorhabdus litoris]|uniref:Hydantoinase/oxoprolinase family protein n=1 Tax=Parasphingorhabdus litoris TaxID=394733 RepID=A0ABN1AQ11_9SPHN|nr:hydantoinase/oxoprolinase family protein [Parasphingorhabdus litoris]